MPALASAIENLERNPPTTIPKIILVASIKKTKISGDRDHLVSSLETLGESPQVCHSSR